MNKSSFAFWRYGYEYLEAFSLINKAKPNPADLLNIKFFLLCRSIEHSLKAYLLLNGYSEKQLKEKFSHNIYKLLMEIDGLAILFNIIDYDIQVIFKANEYYNKKEFEYFRQGEKIVPWLVDLQKIAGHFNCELRKKV